MAQPQLLDAEPMIAPAVFTIDEAAAYLKTPKSSLYRLAQNGKVPAMKSSRFWLFPKADLDAWMSREVKKQMGQRG